MASNKPPLVLLHPLAMSGNAWREVGPLVSSFHELYVPTAVGHRGGLSVQRRPATMTDMVDAAQRYLDECGLDRPHVAGNSMGGFVAIELARRGRAATVCAFSPVGLLAGGGWFSEASIQQAAARRRARSFLTSSPAPPLQVRNVASAQSCATWPAMQIEFQPPGPSSSSTTASGAQFSSTSVPRSGSSRGSTRRHAPSPLRDHCVRERETLVPPEAQGKDRTHSAGGDQTLPDVGHVPMVDDPGLVARTILTRRLDSAKPNF